MASIMTSRHLSTPRSIPLSGYVEIGRDQMVEEEQTPGYKAEDYYPASIGEVLNSRYQIVSKLGFGVNSTVWLARDLL